MSEEEKTALEPAKMEADEAREKAAEKVADVVSQLKRDFIGAPIRRAMDAAMSNTQSFSPA